MLIIDLVWLAIFQMELVFNSKRCLTNALILFLHRTGHRDLTGSVTVVLVSMFGAGVFFPELLIKLSLNCKEIQ